MAESKNVKSEPADLRKQYGAPFAIISHDEGARYTSLLSRDFTPPRCLDFQLLQNHRWTDAINEHCRTLGFENIVKMKHNAYHQLTLQFYTTLKFRGDGGFSCRLKGKRVTVTRRTLCDVFGFPDGGHESVPKDFDRDGFWKEITGGRGDFHVRHPPSALIEDPILHMMHRYISHAVFGRAESSTLSVEGLFYLWCLRRRVLVSTPCFLLATFKSVINLKKRRKMCLGNFITAIAVHFGAFDPLATNMMVLPSLAIGLAGMKEKKGSSPVVDTWMLISCDVEQMTKDVFNELEASFDGLEKKFNAMCARFQTFQQEWVNSRHGSMPDVDAELFPGVQSIGSKRSSKNGDRNSHRPCTGKDDIAHTVPQPRSDEFMEPPGSGMKSETRKCLAARDIIEILDSDDEANYTGVAQSSKRVLSSDETNLVMRKKRNIAGSMWKKQVRTVNEDHEKKSVVLRSGHDKVDCSQNDLNDRVSTDSEDESLSDSRMDEFVASLWRKNCVTKFMYEADMLRAFEQDEELCINAVCALYRKKFKNDGFSPIDSVRGCALAEYLIDGDKELRLTRSVLEVKRLKPDVITQCRKLANTYVAKLFDVYCAGDDPLFCQS